MPLQHLPERLKIWRPVRGNGIVLPQANGSAQSALCALTALNILTSYSAPGYTHRASSNGVSFSSIGSGGPNLLQTVADFVANAAGNHSWIVLRNDALGFEFCLDFNAANLWQASVVFSPTGAFTGGSLSARPTATDQIVHRNAVDWLMGNNVARTNISVWHSEDGENTTVMFTTGAFCAAQWLMGKFAQARSGWATPYYLGFDSGNGLNTTTLTASPFRWVKVVGTNVSGFSARGSTDTNMTLNAGASSFLLFAASQKNSSTQMWDLDQLSFNQLTGTNRGRHGVIPDHLWGPSGLVNGDICVDPGNRSRVAIKVGIWVLPWPNNSIWAT